MNLGTHPHVSGWAYRISYLTTFLEYAKSLEDIWGFTREEVTEWYLENVQDHFDQPAP